MECLLIDDEEIMVDFDFERFKVKVKVDIKKVWNIISIVKFVDFVMFDL